MYSVNSTVRAGDNSLLYENEYSAEWLIVDIGTKHDAHGIVVYCCGGDEKMLIVSQKCASSFPKTRTTAFQSLTIPPFGAHLIAKYSIY